MGHELLRRSLVGAAALPSIVLQNLNVFADGVRLEIFRGPFFALPMRELRERHIGATS